MQPKPNISRLNTTNTNSELNMEDAVQSPYGDLEITKYLYESNLQNIFNTYQQNIASLSQQKQQDLQDAYYIREMSKKYLGEYASNVGVGDVSGNLLDVYGQYQSNLTEIEKNYGQLELGLQQQYDQTKLQMESEMLLNEFDIARAEQTTIENQALSDISFNIITGNTNGLSNIDYINEVYASGESNLTEDQYRGLIAEQTAKEQQKESVFFIADLYAGNFGGMTQDEFIDQGIEQGLLSPEIASSFLMSERPAQEQQAFNENVNAFSVGTKTVDDFIAEGLTTEEIDAIVGVVSTDTYTRAIEALQSYYNGNPGALGLDSEGNLITDPEIYIDSIKDKFGDVSNPEALSTQLYNELETFLEVQRQVGIQSAVSGQEVQYGVNQPTFDVINEDGEVVRQQNPLSTIVPQLGIEDWSYLSSNPELATQFNEEGDVISQGVQDLIYFGIGTQQPLPYFVSGESALVNQEEMLDFINQDATTQTYTLVPNKVYQYIDGLYQFRDGEFYKLEQADFDPNVLNTLAQQIDSREFNFDANTYATRQGENWSWKSNGGDLDTFTYNGVDYIEDDRSNSWNQNATQEDEKAVVQEFERIYGSDYKDGQVQIIFFQGSFYLRDANNKFQKLVKV